MKLSFRLSRFWLHGGLWLTGAVSVCAGNWPGFRGPNGAGIGAEEMPPVHFGPTSNLIWKAELPPGLASPVIWKDRLFILAEQGGKLSTICFDRLSGRQEWAHSVVVEKLEPVHDANSHATSTPVTDGKAVYVYFGSFGLLAYDFSGKELWRKPLPMPQTSQNQGTGTSPVLAEGKLILFVQIGHESHLLALSPEDGHELWRASMPIFNNSYATPMVWQEEGVGLVGLVCAQRFTAFALADGQEAWWVNGLGFQACSTPVAAGDRLVIATAGLHGEASNMTPPPPFEEMIKKYDHDSDGLIAYEEIPDGLLFTDRKTSDGQGNMSLKQALRLVGVKSGAKLDRDYWESCRARLTGFRSGKYNQTSVLAVRSGGKMDVTPSRVLWRQTTGVPEIPSPLVWQARLYLIRSGGLLACRDLETGTLIYDNRIDAPGGYFASPVLASGRIYLGSDRGTITVVKAGDSFEVLAHNDLGDPVIASPAMAENTLYIRSAKTLWAFGLKGN
jgi:outer membrane protein assembly factor BamB